MKKSILFLSALVSLLAFTNGQLMAQAKWEAAASSSATSGDKDIVDIALGSENHTTLVAALKAADLVGALQAEGPFTVFAPVNQAFENLPEGTVPTLLKPENKEQLINVLTYHVVPGKLDSKAVVEAITEGNGKAVVETLNGGTLTAYLKDGKVMLEDENGGMAEVSDVDLMGSNGVIHVIQSVLLPK